MKLGLIKKSMICALSLSFCGVLASCTSKSNNGSSNTTNIFTNKDIQAYAKRVANKKEAPTSVSLSDASTGEYNVSGRNQYYARLYDSANNKFYLYLKNINDKILIQTEESESVGEITTNGFMGNYGYVFINFSSGKKMVIDTFGNTVIGKMEANSIAFNKRITNIDSDTTGEASSYEFFNVRTTEGTSTYIYDVKLEVEEDYKFIDSISREKLADDAELDYSRTYKNREENANLKDYTLTMTSTAIVVRDLKGNIVATATFDFTGISEAYVLDDKAFVQISTPVTINDDYTYTYDDDYYLLKTYSIDLKTGVKTEIKDYNYVVTDADEVYGYSEKNNREYIAGINAELMEIDNKRLSLSVIEATVDANGKILSSKIGEKGEFYYLSNDKYLLETNSTLTIINEKGKVIVSSYAGNSFRLSNDGTYFFRTNSNYSTSGYFFNLDNQYLADYKAEYTVLEKYANGVMLVQYENEVYFIKIENGEIKKIGDSFDSYTSTSSKISNPIAGYKYVNYNSTLTAHNVYAVQYLDDEGHLVYEVYSYDGALLKKYENVSSVTLYTGVTSYFMYITTTDTSVSYYVEVQTLRNPANA